MRVVQVHVTVKPDMVDAFIEATLDNARNSLRETGVARFDVLQQGEDPAKFILVEAYRTPEAPAQHKETAHYQKWRDTVAPMMAEARKAVVYENRFPDDREYGQPG